MTANSGAWAYDSDNHYYEPRDCWTRHIEPGFKEWAIHTGIRSDGSERLYFGDRELVFNVVKFDATEPPGALKAILRSKEFKRFEDARTAENMIPAFRNRDARLELMDTQGVKATLMLPSMGAAFEHEVRDLVEPAYANIRAFNRWIEDDWGFGTDGRIFGVPLISLIDLDLACAETDRVIAAGARTVYLKPGPAYGRSIADPYFDPFWARVDEAEIPVVFHISDSGYNELFSAQWGENPRPEARQMTATQWACFFGDRPIMETLTYLVLQNLFGRFPKLQVMSVENGAGWVQYCLRSMDKAAKMGRYGPWLGGKLEDRPSDVFRAHCSVTPYHEDDMELLVKLVGPERVLFGSDYPHPEGLAQPVDEFEEALHALREPDRERIMRDNLKELLHQ